MGWMSPARNSWRRQRTQRRAEGENTPRMMSVGLHCRLVGRPGRLASLARFLEYAASKPKVWVARRIDIARHWLAQHPSKAS